MITAASASVELPERPRIRFLVHGAERTGPPIYLLRLVRHWAVDHAVFTPEVVLARPGPLADSFRAAASTHIARLDQRSPERVGARVLSAMGGGSLGDLVVDASTRRRVGTREPDLTVVNGATPPTIALLRSLRPSGDVAVIAHELSTGWFGNLTEQERSLLLARASRFLAVSSCVSDFLVERLGVDRSAVHVVHPPVDSDRSGRIRTASGRITIVGSGVTDWRKAPELWLRVAAGVRSRTERDDLRFVWFGGAARGSHEFWPLEHEMNHLGLHAGVEFLGDIDDPSDMVHAATLFVSAAREDAYPMACAEAIAAGVPVLGFDGGGIEEMVGESGCGITVPYPREDLLAAAVTELLGDRARRDEMAAAGRRFGAEVLATPAVATQVAAWLVEGR